MLEANDIGRLDGDFDVDAAEELMLDVVSGTVDDLAVIAASLQTFTM